MVKGDEGNLAKSAELTVAAHQSGRSGGTAPSQSRTASAAVANVLTVPGGPYRMRFVGSGAAAGTITSCIVADVRTDARSRQVTQMKPWTSKRSRGCASPSVAHDREDRAAEIEYCGRTRRGSADRCRRVSDRAAACGVVEWLVAYKIASCGRTRARTRVGSTRL